MSPKEKPSVAQPKLFRRMYALIATIVLGAVAMVAVPAIAASQQTSAQPASVQPAAVPTPTVTASSTSQLVSLTNNGSPMFADMVATKTTDPEYINLNLTYHSGFDAMQPEIFFKVSSITCSDGKTSPWNEYAYGQWNGRKGYPKLLTSNFPPGCNVKSLTLSAISSAVSGMPIASYWTMNQDAVVNFP